VRLLIWRHGRTEWNATERYQGQLDSPLDDEGRRQAEAAARAIAALGPTRIVSSDLRRAADTARALADRVGLPVGLDARLREIALGGWSGLTRAEVKRRFPHEVAAWRRGEDIRRGDGETYLEVAERAAPLVTDLTRRSAGDGPVVLVTHGGTARALLGRLLELPPTAWWRFAPLGNCRWSTLVPAVRGWRLAEHNAGVPEAAGPVAQAPDVEPVHSG
jgi:broad specificity phosphatase PhoE